MTGMWGKWRNADGRGLAARVRGQVAGAKAGLAGDGIPDQGRKGQRSARGGKAGGRRKGAPSHGEEVFALHVKAAGLTVPEREYRFDTERMWRFDFAWPARRLAVEVEGGTWSGGRHTRGKGYQEDLEKYNAAAVQGWTVLRFTTGQVKTGEALAAVLAAMEIQIKEVM